MKKHKIDINEWPNNPGACYGPLSMRLLNGFFASFDIKTIKQAKSITKEKFISLGRLGIKSWNELQEYIKEYEHLEEEK